MSVKAKVYVAVIVSVISAISAILSAAFAWRSIDIAREQNAISVQTALLESLIQKRARLEIVNDEIHRTSDWLFERLSTSRDKIESDGPFTLADAKKVFREIQFTMQKASLVILGARHYFDKNDIKQLEEWRYRIDEAKSLDSLGMSNEKDDILSKFNKEIIPAMLAETQKGIEDLEAKLEKSSK